MSSTQRITYPISQMWQSVFIHVNDAAVEEYSKHSGEPAYEPLAYLHGSSYPGNGVAVREGATYKSLAYIGHLLDMDSPTRAEWYAVAESIAVSQAHVGIIIARLHESSGMIMKLEEMLINAA